VLTAAALRPMRVATNLYCLKNMYCANALVRMGIVLMPCAANRHRLGQELLQASLPLANSAQVPHETPLVL